MIIWLVGAVIVILAALVGFFMGAIRSAVSLIGTLVAALSAKTVGGWIAGLVPLIGFRNPIWQFYLPPLLGFVVVSLVFFTVALVVHHFVQKQLRNKTDEYAFARWMRLNQRAGIAVGAGLGTVWLILLAVLAYIPAYLTTQLADTEEDSAVLRYANSFAHGMEDTGLLKIVERFQPAGEKHFIGSDILGLVYSNPAIQSRLASYPPFVGLAEKPEISELSRDVEVNNLIQSRASVKQVLEHEKIRAVVDNHELVNELLDLDLRDLEAYLRTGVSDKYKDEHILGRWRLNVRRSIAEMKLTGSDTLPPVEFNLLRRALNVYLDDLTLAFTTDNRALVKVKARNEQKLLQVVGQGTTGGTAAAAATANPEDGGQSGPGPGISARTLVSRAIPQQDSAPAMDPALRQRYGLSGPGGAGGAGAAAPGARPLSSSTPAIANRPTPPRSSTSTLLAPMMTTKEGAWSKADGAYKMRIPQDGGPELLLDVQVKENQMVASIKGRTLVFDRI